MKKIIATLASLAIAAGVSFAQDVNAINAATDVYNAGASALQNDDKAGALEALNEAYRLASTLGEDGAAIVADCKAMIPSLSVAVAKDLIRDAEYDAAIAKLQEAVAVCEQFEDFDKMGEAKGLIPQVLMQKGNALITAKDYAAAAEAFKAVLADNPQNGNAALRLGMALGQTGDIDGAVAAYEQAIENGQEKNAKKQLSTIFLKKAAAALKAKDYASAIANANKSNEYVESAQAYQIAGTAAQVTKKNADAIESFEKYLQLQPSSKDAGKIAFTIAALYQQAGNKAKAKEFYQKASTDPTYGAEATKQAAAIK